MAVESLLEAEVGALAKKLHTGRSRNDQVATDLKLWCRKAVSRLEFGIDKVIAATRMWAATQGRIAMPAYTHRQVAIPVLGSLWIEAALVRPLERDRALLWSVRDELSESPLGAGAIAGSSLPIDPEITAEALGFTSGPVNPIDAVGHRDHALTLAFVCARIASHVARFGADLVELASDGLASLDGAIACGSSMMPHKRNPDLFELVRGGAAARYGELMTLLSLMHGLGTGYHRDLQHDKETLFRSVDGTVGTLDMVALSMSHFSLVEARCLTALREGDAIATDLCEALVASGVPFRDAYRRIGALVQQQCASGHRLADLGPDDLAAHDLPASCLERLDPVACARARTERFQKAPAVEAGEPPP
jgi:argininosuccinate lyase